MAYLIQEKRQKARKDYNCDASLFISGGYEQNLRDLTGVGLNFSEWRCLINARNKEYKIKKGEQYLNQTIKDDSGDLRTFRCIEGVHKICVKFDLYPDE